VDALKQGARGDTQSGRSRRISGLLVVAEVGLAFAALVTLGLFLRSLYGLENTPAGFDHRGVTVCRLFLATNAQMTQQFQVDYADGTFVPFTQNLSDWHSPQNFPGEATALNMPYLVVVSIR
jgi:hypothetical protein